MSVGSTELAAPRAPRRPASPYVGLVPFAEEDAAFFFGRSREAAIVAANLRASRLTVLYGPSGVGKSSLLAAGVVRELRAQARRGDAEHPFATCLVRDWHDDPLRTVARAARESLEEIAGDAALEPDRPSLAESLRAWTAAAGTLLVVLDQFDEYLRYHPDEHDGERLTGFAAELAAIVNDPALPVNVLISIREDAWAKLDRFEGHVPLLFANYLRVDHLDLDAAREAIEGPVAAWNRGLAPGEEPYELEPALTAAVLEAAAGGAGLAGGTGPGAPGNRVEAPFLQLVLERLWRATAAEGGHVLTPARLEQLGGATAIVENHVLEALRGLSSPEQDVASACFRFLASSEQARVAQSAANLAECTGVPEATVVAVLERLCTEEGGRVLRAVAPAEDGGAVAYELFHDVLGAPVLAWRRAHEQERTRRAFRRRLLRVGGAALALVTVFAGLAVWALVERGHAQSRAADLRAFNTRLREQNATLAQRASALTRSLKLGQEGATAAAATVGRLRTANAGLRRDVAQLRTRRDGLAREVASLRRRNRQLSAGIARLNTANAGLAATINRLERGADLLTTKLALLAAQEQALTSDASILKAERRSLSAQLEKLTRENAKLLATAEALGYHLPPETASQSAPVETPRHRTPTVAAQFGIPAALAASDALRRRVARLQQELARLDEQRARQANALVWLRSENRLLRQQRAALRREDARLDATRVRFEAREHELARTLAAAQAEHARLSAKAATARAAYRRIGGRVAARREATAKLQSRNNDGVETIGELQGSLAGARAANGRLVGFLRGATQSLVRAAEDPAHDPALAGLLAVEAFRVTPDDPDGAERPDVYNALWLALSRLDARAAKDLIAPAGNARGKIGTTRSALLERKLCGLSSRGLTRDEWSRYLPAGAPYPSGLARPCG